MVKKINKKTATGMRGYEELSQEECVLLLKQKDKDLKSKKLGLYWDAEREPEKVVVECEKKHPILNRIERKSVKTRGDESEPNLLIEGDNYHALQVLNYTHKGKIDVIYIDPPYNTGKANEWKYNDKYVDENDGYRHSKWLNMMKTRLRLAKDLLSESGAIFMSIDDNEQANLRLLCNEIFGESNFIANIVWRKKYGGGKGSRFFVDLHEYVLVYAKDVTKIDNFLLERSDDQRKIFKEKDEFYEERGLYYIRPLKSGLAHRKTLIYPIECPDGTAVETQWICARDTFEQLKEEGRIVFKKLKNGKFNVYKKFYEKDGDGLVLPESILYELAYNQNGKEELKEIFNITEGRDIPFENPKPTILIKYLIKMVGGKSAAVLDFMAGSGTTGHAVLELNKEDDGNRRFILCTNNENNNGNGSGGIAESVCFPRIQKVIKGYKHKKGGNGEEVKVEGLGGNLEYFKTGFVENSKNINQLKYNLTQRCGAMLCVKEGVFNKYKKEKDFDIYLSNDKKKYLCIYYSFRGDTFEKFIKELEKIKGKKVIYVFEESDEVERDIFKTVKNKSIAPIPRRILDVYSKIIRDNKKR